MKNILQKKTSFQLIILGFIFTNTLFAESEEVIDVKEAYKHIGETKIVCGRIAVSYTHLTLPTKRIV